MKIRTDFVTNSSSSGFVCINVKTDESQFQIYDDYDSGWGGWIWNYRDTETLKDSTSMMNQMKNSDVRLNMILKDAVWTGGGMFDTLTSFKRRNMFTYKLAVFYPDKGESDYKKILNGKEIDVIASGTEDIINKEASDEWWSYMLDLWAEFDFDKYHDKLIQLQEIVRTNIPKSEVPYCEGTWEDGELHILCSSIQWNCKSLKEVQVFLDKLNEVLLPIKDELDAGGEGTWEISSEFAVATWDWTDQGYKVKGICY